jgi:hypothetical protein
VRRPLPNLAPIEQRACQVPEHPDGLYGVYLDENTGLTVLYSCHQAVFAIEWASDNLPIDRFAFTMGDGAMALYPGPADLAPLEPRKGH